VEEEKKDYYEIQLDNKQLIFLFFLAVVICGVFFLVGVKVGRDAARLEAEANKIASKAQKLETKEIPPPSVVALPKKEEPKKTKEFGYFKLMEGKKAGKTVTPGGKPQSPAKKEEKPSLAPSKPKVKKRYYAVQVASTRSKREALSLRDRLKRKGYSAFVKMVEEKGRRVYKVRVGRFKNRIEAISLRDTLRIKEGFKDAWIVATS